MRRNAIATPSTTLHWQSGDQRRRRSLPALQPGDTLGTVLVQGTADLARQIIRPLAGEMADQREFEGQVEGLAAGRTAALAGQTVPAAGDGSIYGRSYDAAARAGYADALTNRIALRAATIAQDVGDDLKRFDAAITKEQATFAGLPDDIRAAAELELSVFAARERGAISTRVAKRQADVEEMNDRSALELFEIRARQAARAGDVDRVQEMQAFAESGWATMVAAGRASPQEAAKNAIGLSRDIVIETHRGEFERVLETQGMAAARRYIEAAKADPVTILDPQSGEKLFAELDRTLDGLVREAEDARRRVESQQREELAWAAEELSLSIAAAGTQADVEQDWRRLHQLRREPGFRASTFGRLARELKGRELSLNEDLDDVSRAAAAMEGSMPLDPTDAGHRRAVDKFYASRAKDLSEPAEQWTAGLDIARRLGILPSPLARGLHGLMNGGTAEQKVHAARTISSLEQDAPRAAEKLADRERRVARLINDYVDAGAPPQLAVERAEDVVLKADDAVTKARLADLTPKIMAERRTRLMSDLDTSWWTDFGLSNPNVSDPLFAAYETWFRDAYAATRDQDAAHTEALGRIKREWAVSRVDGAPKFMRRPPERIYGLQGFSDDENAEWMQEQLRAEAASRPDLQSGKVTLAPSPYSLRGTHPQWMVLKDGTPVPDEAYPSGLLHWRPDWLTAPLHTRLAAERNNSVERNNAAGALEAAREDRKLFLEQGGESEVGLGSRRQARAQQTGEEARTERLRQIIGNRP